jgi:hypothetical protein
MLMWLAHIDGVIVNINPQSALQIRILHCILQGIVAFK